jgi:hypothetical protein
VARFLDRNWIHIDCDLLNGSHILDVILPAKI